MRKVALVIGVLAMCSLVGLAYAYKGTSSNRAEPVHPQTLESPQPLGERADGVPAMVNYQGKLLDDVGNPVTDTLPMAFSIWDDPTAGTRLWDEIWVAIPVIGGIFNVLLGQSTPIPETVFEGSDRWLQTVVLLDTLLPRQSMVSVPYSYDADKVDNFHASATPGPNDLFPLSYGDGQWVNEGQADAITSPMILNGEIVRADCDPAFKAPYADTADYALAFSGAVDSARVAGNSWRLENNTLTDLDVRWVNEGQADAITSGMILNGEVGSADLANGAVTSAKIIDDAVTSAKVLDGTVLRADCDPAFKAPYADTADYALASPAVDSARVAGNSWRLENNTLTDLDGRWVDEGQADAITSGMVTDGEIVRADCDPAFKAPYADTADYALAFSGAVDSARVAGNSWRLENNTLTDLDGRWVNEGQVNSITSAMITDGQVATADLANGAVTSAKIVGDAVTSAKVLDGTVLRADCDPAFKAPYADTADYALAFSGTVDSARVAGNSWRLENNTLTDLDTRWVNEGQANSITSGMITDGEVVDADVSATADIAPSKILGTAWTSLNDGTGSTLDADLLDGLDSSDFLSTASDFGRSGVAADLYEGASTLTALYVNEGQVNSITSGMITDGQVTSADIADLAVTSAKITDGAVTSAKIADGEIVDVDVSATADIDPGKILGMAWTSLNDGPGSTLDADYLDGLDSSDFLSTASDFGRSGVAADLYEGASTLTALYVNEGQVDAITTGMILDGEVGSADIADLGVATVDIADQAVTGAKIEVGANVSGANPGTYVFQADNTDASGYGISASNPASTGLGATGAAIYIDGKIRVNDTPPDKPVGLATILNGSNSITVPNNCATAASYIFVTQVYDFFAPHQAVPLQVEKGPAQFTILTNNPVMANVQIMYLIIN